MVTRSVGEARQPVPIAGEGCSDDKSLFQPSVRDQLKSEYSSPYVFRD